MNVWRPTQVALGALFVFGALFAVWGALGWGAPAANEQAIGEVSRWCERVGSGFLREPVNTLGNLGFVVAGFVMLVTLARDVLQGRSADNRMIGNSPVAALYAGAAFFLGPGSMVMHGTHTFFGAWLDNVSMVAYILVPWLLNLALLGRWNDRRLFGVYAAILAGYAAGYWFVGPDLGIGLDLFGASIGIWVVSEVVYRFWGPSMRVLSGLVGFGVALIFGVTPAAMLAAPGEYWWVILFWVPGILATGPPPGRRRYLPWYWVGVLSFVGAYAIWLTGTAEHPRCDPDSLVQAHAIWHLLSALAAWAFFVFLRTERQTSAGTNPADGRPLRRR